MTAVNTDLDDFTRRRQAVLQWATELKGTINDLKQRKARLRPEAAQHDISQVSGFVNNIPVDKNLLWFLIVDGHQASHHRETRTCGRNGTAVNVFCTRVDTMRRRIAR